MRLQNISYKGSDIFLFCREEDGSLSISKDRTFLPYYYQESPEGKHKGYDGTSLIRIDCDKPSDINKQRNSQSWEADIPYVKRYLIDKVDVIEKSNPRILYFDIEINAKKLPKPREDKEAPYPISTIVTYDNYKKEYKTFFISDYQSEWGMLEDFCKHVHDLAPDMACAWNCQFDFYYLSYRIPDFAKKISPIGLTRWKKDIEAPAGISMVDLLGFYYKLTLGKKDSYALMNVAHDELGYEIEEDFDFTDIEVAKEKCKLDVKKMVELNDKLNLIAFFDETRTLSKCLWEDLPAEKATDKDGKFKNTWQSNNSKVVDMLALQEAKNLGVVLPSKNYDDTQEGEMEGAFREVFGTGLYNNLAKVDLSGAYPQAIIDFCLSPENLSKEPSEGSIKIDVHCRKTGEFKATYYYKQNPNAILPSLVKKILALKNELKDKLNSTSKNDPEYEKLQVSYDSRKAVTNSSFGVIALKVFRLFSAEIGDTITFLIRDLLHFVMKKMEKEGRTIRYIDTDSVMYEGRDDLSSQLNKWAVEWGMDKYEHPEVKLSFDYEGFFSSIFIAALCRYRGRLETSKGQKIETKGLQMKRRDSGVWVKSFQKELFDKILDGGSKENLLEFIKQKIEEMKQAPLTDIAIPCKLNKERSEYKTSQAYFEALDLTKEIVPEFNKEIGERFKWFYMQNNKRLAFDTKYQDHILREEIDWTEMIQRNIFNLLVPTFKGLNWSTDLLDLAEEYGIILGSGHRNKLLENLPDFEELKKYYGVREVKKRMKGEGGLTTGI